MLVSPCSLEISAQRLHDVKQQINFGSSGGSKLGSPGGDRPFQVISSSNEPASLTPDRREAVEMAITARRVTEAPRSKAQNPKHPIRNKSETPKHEGTK